MKRSWLDRRRILLRLCAPLRSLGVRWWTWVLKRRWLCRPTLGPELWIVNRLLLAGTGLRSIPADSPEPSQKEGKDGA